MDDKRIRPLNDEAPQMDGQYVLYWMQQSQRSDENPALELAIRRANELDVPLVAGFGLMANYPGANRRHFAFMLQGLSDAASCLKARNIKLVVRRGSPDEVALELGKSACLIVCDRGYLRHQRRWRENVARQAGKCVVQVEGDVVVPVEEVSDKAEYAARTIRPKINGLQGRYLHRSRPGCVNKSSLRLRVSGDIDVTNWEKALDKLQIGDDVGITEFRGGYSRASDRLTSFLRSDLDGYASQRNDPVRPRTSVMSPYLHFGQISPIEIACKVSAAKSGSDEDRDAYLEELIVRRELAMNFVYYTEDYDKYSALPDWARKTLDQHKGDERPQRYTRTQLENGETEDAAWNAAMGEARVTGFMHNYMRMYWGKKILEWCNTPAYAYRTMLYLMNRYFLDGRDPCSYSGVGWVCGLHDRAWQERDVFGKVRSMTAAGLQRKFDVDGYIERIGRLSPAG